jgi:transposase
LRGWDPNSGIAALPTYEELAALVVALQKELAAARARIVELEARLNQNSQNSSKPPSSDPPGVAPSKGKRRKGRKRGGQPGRLGRFAAEPERIDHIQQHRPTQCGHCRASLANGHPTGTVINHSVYDLPDIRPLVTAHQCLDIECPNCGLVTCAELPTGIPAGRYGPSVQAMTGLLRGELRQSVRQTSSVMTQVLHAPMSTGAVAKTQDPVSRALAAPFEEALAHARGSDRAHADETGWRQDKKKAWLWVAVTALVTVFLVRVRRNAAVAKELLGESFSGILSTDRWASYNWVQAARRQLCWSHLKRDFKSFLDYGPEAKHLGERLLRERRKLFRLWHRVRDGTLTRAQLQLASQPVRRRILSLLEEGTGLSSHKVSGMCREMLKLKAALFTFIDIERVEPTNNAAERAIRFAVLLRKGCFGSDSAKGSRFIERFLTTRATLRIQRRDLYTFLKAACTAALHGTPSPSLLPASPASFAQAAAAA